MTTQSLEPATLIYQVGTLSLILQLHLLVESSVLLILYYHVKSVLSIEIEVLNLIMKFVFVHLQTATEPSVGHHSVSPNLMFGFRPISGSTSNVRIRSTSPTFAVHETQPSVGHTQPATAHTVSVTAHTATTLSSPPRPRPTGPPTRGKPQPRRKRKHFLMKMIESIMRPISSTMHAMISG